MTKLLLTVDFNNERLLVPFDSSRTCGELQTEVSRRIRLDRELNKEISKFGYKITSLRMNGRDGPRLFEDDIVSDVVLSCGDPIYVVTDAPSTLPELLARPSCSCKNCEDDQCINTEDGIPCAATPPLGSKTDSDQLEENECVQSERETEKEVETEKLGRLFPTFLFRRRKRKSWLDMRVSSRKRAWNRTAAKLLTKETESASSSDTPNDVWYFGRPTSAEIRYVGDKRAEWTVHGIKDQLEKWTKGTRIFSPEFTIQDIPMSLVFYPNGNANAKPGFCSLGLKAPHGTHLRYKLFLGKTERYTELRHNVTESWGFVDMYRMKDMEGDIKSNSDLSLGVEIIADIDKDETHLVVEDSNASRVEWVIRTMKEKMKCYKKDVALYSQEFTLAGVDKLRIKFYPKGKQEADDGFCSLYLEAPKGSEIRVRLSVGKKSMSFDRVEKFGTDSIWGFLNLCKILEELENDEVKIAVEILETKRLDARLTESEDSYLKTRPPEERRRILEELSRMEKLRNADASVPSRFRILQLALPDAAKAVALQKWDSLQNDTASSEATKLRKWIDGLLLLPLGKITRPVVSLCEGHERVKMDIERAAQALNSAVYGHEEPKEKILQLLCQWISNPDSTSFVMGIQGPPGNGKTSLCRTGIAVALGRPFVQISLGGATDGAILEGHSFTYVGSTWGRIAQMLMDARSMNPVIFFDELDKISETSRGDEIVGILTHLTDQSQNKEFTDRYFEGIPMDMSKAMLIFSFNDESKINNVLKDRLTIIHTEGFNIGEQLSIAQLYLLPDLLINVGMRPGDITIKSLSDLQFLYEYCGMRCEKGGVRALKKALEACVLHANKRRLLELGEVTGKATPGKAEVEYARSTRGSSDLSTTASTNTPKSAMGCTSGSELTAKNDAEKCAVWKLEEFEEDESLRLQSPSCNGNTNACSPRDSCATSCIHSDERKEAWPDLENNLDDLKTGELTTARCEEAKAQAESKRRKLPKFTLPLVLTRENIEWLLTRKPQADEVYRSMYL